MSEPLEIPKLRLASTETESLAHRVERERVAAERQREMNLEGSLAPFRAGSVPYLNAAPLTRGLEDEVVFAPPSQLAELLRRGEIDAGLLSITEVLFQGDYEILDGIAIASLGEVFSVFLAHREPLEAMRVVECDPASLTSVNLLKVLLAEKGLQPEFRPLTGAAREAKNVLLIGNPAIDFRRSARAGHEIWDLGSAWFEMTKLPFVYAVWVLRTDKDTKPLRQILREARDFGMDTLDYLIDSRSEYDRDFRKDYLGWHIHYHLGSDEKRGVERFRELLARHSGREVHAPRYVV